MTAVPLRVAAAEEVGDGVRALTLVRDDGALLPFSAGSHVVVHVPAGGRARRNPYSLACAPWRTDRYRIVVRKLPDGRGSRALHEDVAVGDRLEVEPPQNFFRPVRTARRHVLVAGGIGITPFVSYAHELRRRDVPFELHYSVRDAASAPLLDELRELCGDDLRVYEDPDGSVLLPALAPVLRRQPLGTHLSTCGPAPMMDAVIGAARDAGWPESRLHLELFALDLGPMEPFAVELARSGARVAVPESVTMLDALEDAGVAVPSLCRLGFCGECRTPVLAGVPDHRDSFLSPEAHEAGDAVMPCVSRCTGTLVLDL